MSRRLRSLSVCLFAILVLAGSTVLVGAQPNGGGQGGDQGNGQGPPDGTPAGNTSEPDASGNATSGNATSNDANATGQSQGESARERERDERRGLSHDTVRQERAPGLELKYSNWNNQLTPAQRDATGMFFAEDGRINGTFVSFVLDERRSLLHNVTLTNGTMLFEEIWLPVSDEDAVARLTGNALRIEGDDWSFRIQDAASVPIKFDVDDDEDERFVLRLPNGTSTAREEQPRHRFHVVYPASPDGTNATAYLMHDVRADEADPRVLVIEGEADYYVAARYVALHHVTNKARPDLQAALQEGRLGAELAVLRTPGDALYEDGVLYEDMSLDITSGTATGEAAEGRAFTITVDANLTGGRTIAVTFQNGLLDTDTLGLRYFSVDPNRTIEAPIVPADDIHDVLDPSDDGTITEYWIVEDVDGVQVLLSIPHFSTHKIELLSMFVLEKPALVFGILGAVLVVAVGTRGLFRRPGDA